MLLYGWLQKAAKARGGTKSLIYRDTYLSWRGLAHRVDRRADEFAAAGVRPGDLVGLMLGNVPDFIILSLALSRLKAAPLPLDPTASSRELEMLMAKVPLRGLITRPRGGEGAQATASSTQAPAPSAPAPAPTATPAGKGSRRRAVPESRRRLQGTLLSCSIFGVDARPVPKKAEDQTCAVLVTADSAGDPKPVERTAANLLAEAQHLAQALELTEEDRALLTVPLFHSFGFDVGMAACFFAGATIYLEDEIAANRIAKLVRDQKITLLPGTLTLFAEMGRLPASRPLSHKPIRFVSLGGGLTGAALESFREKYGVRPMSCFHTTETGTVSLDARGQNGDSVGKSLEGVELRVADPKTDKPLAAGKLGALWVKSDAISPLKLGTAPGSSKSAPSGTRDAAGYFRTGDLASLDRSGRLVLAGREDDLVRLDGKRVAPPAPMLVISFRLLYPY